MGPYLVGIGIGAEVYESLVEIQYEIVLVSGAGRRQEGRGGHLKHLPL